MSFNVTLTVGLCKGRQIQNSSFNNNVNVAICFMCVHARTSLQRILMPIVMNVSPQTIFSLGINAGYSVERPFTIRRYGSIVL